MTRPTLFVIIFFFVCGSSTVSIRRRKIPDEDLPHGEEDLPHGEENPPFNDRIIDYDWLTRFNSI